MILENIKHADIKRNPWNPHFATKQELETMLAAFLSKGFRKPVLVVEWDVPVLYNGQNIGPEAPYMLVDGEQRWTAYGLGIKEGKLPETIPTLLMGKLSEFTSEELMELGQMLNHVKGTGEDLAKTGLLVEALRKKGRSVADIAAAMNQDKNFINNALAAIDTRTKQVPVRIQNNEEREDIIMVLRFTNEDDHADADELLVKAISLLEAEGLELPTTRRYRRSAALMEVLKSYVYNRTGP